MLRLIWLIIGSLFWDTNVFLVKVFISYTESLKAYIKNI